MVTPEVHVDLLVVGAGMAGLAAAACAAEAGAAVGVLEKTAEVGGSAALSAGMLWTARSIDEFQARMPEADLELGRALVDGFPDAIEAVRATGVEISKRVEGAYFGFGGGWQIDIIGFLRRCVVAVEAGGGWIVRGTMARRLLNDSGRVIGATISGPDGTHDVGAAAILLATGGFQGDPELVAAMIGPHADGMLVRSNAGSVGDGFHLAREAGGAASRSLGGFYGHLMPYPLPRFEEKHFLPLTQYHSIHCILVNRHGRRFIDECRGDEYANQALLHQPERRAVLVADEKTRSRYVITEPYPGGETIDRFQAAADAGANYVRADTLDALVDAIATWGVPAGTLRATLNDYARAAAGDRVVLDAPLPAQPSLLSTPPFHALEVQPALTFPLGGIRIDRDGRVLDRDGEPVGGLYAAGADSGGVFHVGYAGGLASALVFGRRAARAALSDRTREADRRVTRG